MTYEKNRIDVNHINSCNKEEKDIIKEISTFPVNDRSVYVEKSSGIIFERVGIVVKVMGGDDDNPFSTLYVDERGCVMTGGNGVEEDFCEAYEKLGKVGDSVTPFDISKALDINLCGRHGDIEDVIDMAEDYFVIDKSKAEDTVKIRISVDEYGKGQFCCDSNWYGFPTIKGINLDDPGSCSKYYNHPVGLTDLLVEPLVFYTRYLGKSINLDIDFNNYFDQYEIEEKSDEKIQLRNDEIDIYRRKYLANIREFIEKKFRELRDKNKYDPVKVERRRVLKEKFEFVNQDGKVIPLSV